jgi:uncharacterized protein YndB with AHSA1/START domain
MPASDRRVSAERVIAAPPEKIFAVLADPGQHPVIDGSATLRQTRGDTPPRLSLGARFGMNMKDGVPYFVKNTVVEFEENRRIAWRHFARNVWRYELEPVEGGTRVVETFDWSNLTGVVLGITGLPAKNKANMEKTLERLDKFVTTGSPE